MAYSKLFAEMNSTPSHFMRDFTPIDTKLLPPLLAVNYNNSKSGARSNPIYQSVSMKSFSSGNMESFPTEMLPGRGEHIHRQTNEFTNSFIAGAYRDNRMGVAELRKKRIARLKEKQELIAIVQKSLADDVNKIQKRSARRIKRDVERTRRLANLQSVASAIIIQKAWRIKMVQIKAEREKARLAEEEIKLKKKQRDELEHKAASCIARAVLKYLAYKYSRMSRRMSAGDIILPDNLSFYNNGTLMEDEDDDDSGGGGGVAIKSSHRHDSIMRYSMNKDGSLTEANDGTYDENGNNILTEMSTKDLANHYFNSLLSRQHDEDDKFVTQIMMKTLNEAPSQRERMREQEERDRLRLAQELEIQKWREKAALKIQCNIRGAQGRTAARNRRLLKKVFKGWRSYREPKDVSRRPSRTSSINGEGAGGLDGPDGRPTTPNDVFSNSILDMLKKQKQDDLEDASAVAIQCLFRAQRAQRASKRMKLLKARNMKKKKEDTAKAILARIPQEKPDRSCTSAWLQQESYEGNRRKHAVVHGVVDLSKTSRSPFWLQTSGDSSELNQKGLKNTGRDSAVRQSSVKAMISHGLGPYFKQ